MADSDVAPPKCRSSGYFRAVDAYDIYRNRLQPFINIGVEGGVAILYALNNSAMRHISYVAHTFAGESSYACGNGGQDDDAQTIKAELWLPLFTLLYTYDTENEITNRMRHFGGEDSSSLKRDVVEGLTRFLDEHNELVKLFKMSRNKCTESNILDFKIRLYNVVGIREYKLLLRLLGLSCLKMARKAWSIMMSLLKSRTANHKG
ncbi:hypothetical protein Tco_0675156 [Tanacetum coccineum]